MNAPARTFETGEKRRETNAWAGWVPLVALPVLAFAFGLQLPSWEFMWMMAFALYYGCKWLTWWRNRNIKSSAARRAGYLFLWPGMDAKAFLNPANKPLKPRASEYLGAVGTVLCGVVVVWGITCKVPDGIIRGWVGLVGLALVLNFGTFRLLSLAWRAAGVEAKPLMRAPILATSLGEFWGERWNSAFNRLMQDLVFRPLRGNGITTVTMLVFLVSGLVHELVISVPARGGYGLPTIYFLIQGGGLLFERSGAGRRFGLRSGLTGWLFTMAITAGPAFILFHPVFIRRVILPFLHVLKAT